MAPAIIRIIGIVLFASAFVLILIVNNAEYDRQAYDKGLMLLTQLSSQLGNKYFYGRAPETLEEILYADEREDPWGKRFRYAPVDDTFLIWSAGPNNQFEPLADHEDDVLVFQYGIVESWTTDSLTRMLEESDHVSLAQIMFLENNPELKRAASQWSVRTGHRLRLDYTIR